MKLNALYKNSVYMSNSLVKRGENASIMVWMEGKRVNSSTSFPLLKENYGKFNGGVSRDI